MGLKGQKPEERQLHMRDQGRLKKKRMVIG